MASSDFESDRSDAPVTPHAAPIVDGQGRLTYVGDDGRRYVVGLPPELDEQSVERLMEALRGGVGLFQQIEQLSRRWLRAVRGPELDGPAALALLLTTLETALEEDLHQDCDRD